MKTKIFRLFVSALALLAFCGMGKAEEPQQPALGLKANLAYNYESFHLSVPRTYWTQPNQDFATSERTLPWVVMTFNNTTGDSLDVKFKKKGETDYLTLTDVAMKDGVIAADGKSIRIKYTKSFMLEVKAELGINEIGNDTYVVEYYKKGETTVWESAEFGKPAAPRFENAAIKYIVDSASYVDLLPASYVEKYPFDQANKDHYNAEFPWLLVTGIENAKKAAYGIKVICGKDTVKFTERAENTGIISTDKAELFTNAGSAVFFDFEPDFGVTGFKAGDSCRVEIFVDGEKTTLEYEVPAPVSTPAAGDYAANTEISVKGVKSETDSVFVALGDTKADATNFVKADKNEFKFNLTGDTLVRAFAMRFGKYSDTVEYEFNIAGPIEVAAPTFVKKNGAQADTIIVLMGAANDSLFVATGRDSLSAVAAGFAKFLKNDTIAVNKDTVVVAYAMKGELVSDTVKYVYKKVDTIKVNDLAGLNALYNSFDKEAYYAVKGEVTITAIFGTDIYVQDKACAKAEGHSMLLYRVSSVPTGAKVGDVMTGVKGQLAKYSGLLEMKNVVASSLKLTGATADVTIDDVTIADVNADETMKYQSAMVRFTDVEFVDVDSTFKSGNSYKLFKGNDTIALWPAYRADYLNTKVPAGKGTIVACMGYHDAYQISPRNKADMAFTPAVVVPDTVKAPTFSVEAGEVTKGTKVELKSATTGADIYYTVDGSAPTATSTKYTAAITIDSAMTIKAIAIKEGMENSKISEAKYTIKSVANEGSELAGVSVYPNPSKGEFYVTVPVNATVEVYAANGQRVSAKAAVAGKNLVKVNNAGIYFVRVRANGQEAIRKVVVR